jgi:glycosyltransferase involved in cell wall biosynthesis
MFSIIIPLYNKAPYIEKAIRSVFDQTYQEFELIVVDDGSKDDGLEKAQKFKSSKVQIIEQINSGVSTARNNGVKRAKYDYLVFLDADDWWEPAFLEEMKMLIEDFPEGALYASSYFRVKNRKNIPARIGVPTGFQKGYFDYCKTYAAALQWMPVWTGTVVLKKDIFKEMQGFKPNLKLGEDFDLWIRIALKYKVVLLNKPLAYYNQDIELQNRAIGKLQNPQTHILWNLDYLHEEEQKNIDLKQLLDNMRVYALFPYFLNKNYRETAKAELKKVDWSRQPESAKRKYELPIGYLKAKNCFMKVGSRIKQLLIKHLNN